jgi:hypothetical protein
MIKYRVTSLIVFVSMCFYWLVGIVNTIAIFGLKNQSYLGLVILAIAFYFMLAVIGYAIIKRLSRGEGLKGAIVYICFFVVTFLSLGGH